MPAMGAADKSGRSAGAMFAIVGSIVTFVAATLIAGLVVGFAAAVGAAPGDAPSGSLEDVLGPYPRGWLLALDELLVGLIGYVLYAAWLRPELRSSPRAARRPWPEQIAVYAAVMAGVATAMYLITGVDAYWRPGPSGVRLDVRPAIVALVLSARAGLLEELVFRQYLQQALEQAWGTVRGVGGASFVFVALHAIDRSPLSEDLLAIGAVSLLMGYALVLTRSIWVPVALHFAWDATILLWSLYYPSPHVGAWFGQVTASAVGCCLVVAIVLRLTWGSRDAPRPQPRVRSA